MATTEEAISVGMGFRVKYIDMGDGSKVPAVAVVYGSGGGGGGGGDASAANQVTGNASLASIDGKVATQVTLAALLAKVSADPATQTTLAAMSAKLPATLGTKASAAALAVVLASDDAQIGTKVTAVTALPAGGAGIIGWLSNIWSALTGLLVVNTLAQPAVARQLAVAASSGASVNTALTTTCRRISIYARNADVRYAIGSAAQTASATTHFIAAGERLDLAVPATPNIAVLGATLTTGTLEVSELS